VAPQRLTVPVRAAGCVLAALAAACVPPGERRGEADGRMVPRDLPGPETEAVRVDPPAIAWPQPAPQHPAVRVDPIDPDPERLLDAGPDTVRGVLGPPTRVRNEPPARIWQYVSERCVLDVFLYERDGRRTAVHLDARDRDAAPLEARTCLRSLLTQRAAGGV